MKFISILVSIILVAGSLSAQNDDITINNVEMPKLNWGNQKANISITNKSDYLKFVVVETTVKFLNSTYNTNRTVVSNHVLVPGEQAEINPDVYIPGSFGDLEFTIRMYDVIDTLDLLMNNQIFHEKSYNLKFEIPESVKKYTDEELTLPPRVNEHPFFCNELVRVLIVLLNEGKSVEEIAKITQTDENVIMQLISDLNRDKLVGVDNDSYKLTFPVILKDEVAQTKELVETTADSLSKVISANLAGYSDVLDSLVNAKVIPADSFDFISGAALLYKSYPVTSALLLWFDLGQKFITRSAPLLIYDGTDFCNAGNTQYMYAVQGGDSFTGSHVFFMDYSKKMNILFSETPPPVICEKDFILKKKKGQKATFQYKRTDFPDLYLLDTAKVRPLLNLLDKNTNPILEVAYYRLKDIALKNDHKLVSFGHRYWFWNLVAERTLSKLLNNGIIERSGNGFYRFDTIVKK